MAGTYPLCKTIKAYRLDCGCLKYDCESTATMQEVESCLVDTLFKENGQYDFHCDKLETQADIVLTESLGVCSLQLDGEIPNLLCLLESEDCEIPPTGHFKYKDSYGIIYVTDWEYYNDTIDITWTTYDPHVPGEAPSGFMIGKQVYRKGVITTTRQIVEKLDVNTSSEYDINIILDETVQTVDYFRVTFDCGDEVAKDVFKYHLDCAVLDDLEFDIGSGA